MNRIENILIFTNSPSFATKVNDKLKLPDQNITQCSELKEAFDLLTSETFNVFIFETYDCINGKYQGVNNTDLDLLLYFAASDESQNRYIRFLPIDHDSAEAKKAEVLYEPFYENHLSLLNAVSFEDLTLESLYLDEERKMLFELVNTLDIACDHLDKRLTQEKSEGEDEDEEIQSDNSKATVEHTNKDSEAEHLSRITGIYNEDESFSRVGGIHNEDESFSRVSGIHNEDESFSCVSGIHNEDESFSRVSGIHNEDASFSRVSGIHNEDESFFRVSGTHHESEQEPISNTMKIKSLDKDIHHQKLENLKVKHLESTRVETTVEEHQNIDIRNKNGQTPLMLSCLKGDSEAAMTLIHQGANTSLKCKKGYTVLHYACAHPNTLEVAQYLVSHENLKLTVRASTGLDPLAMAIKTDSSDTVKWLMIQGARVQTKIDGQPLLHFAAAQNSFQSFLVLLSQGIPLNQKCNQGLTAEQFCKNKRKLPFLKALKAYTLLNRKRKAA